MEGNMEVAFASDHAGFAYKKELVPHFQKKGYQIIDLGVFDESLADYPDVAEKIAEAVIKKKVKKGIIFCGSGVGVSVAANKFPGIRAGVCHDTYSAHQGVEHDDINVLCLGSRVVGLELCREISEIFLEARFSGEKRHHLRLQKLRNIEKRTMRTHILDR